MFPIIPAGSAANYPKNDEGIFGFGRPNGASSDITNLVSNVGVVASDVTGVGTARKGVAACEFGEDKGIFGFGASTLSMTNLVSNSGVLASDTTGVAGVTGRSILAACGYGVDKGIFGFGNDGDVTDVTNLVSNAGVVATDVSGVGTARQYIAACEYGEGKGIFGFGSTDTSGDDRTSITNLVSNTGVVASDTAGVGQIRWGLSACEFGEDKGIFAYGNGPDVSPTYTGAINLVSNTGVVASDTSGVGSVHGVNFAACEYGQDKGIFGFGYTGIPMLDFTNLITNLGVVGSDVTTVGTPRNGLGACSFN